MNKKNDDEGKKGKIFVFIWPLNLSSFVLSVRAATKWPSKVQQGLFSSLRDKKERSNVCWRSYTTAAHMYRWQRYKARQTGEGRASISAEIIHHFSFKEETITTLCFFFKRPFPPSCDSYRLAWQIFLLFFCCIHYPIILSPQQKNQIIGMGNSACPNYSRQIF